MEDTYSENNRLLQKDHTKKKRGYQALCLSRVLRLSHCLSSEDKQYRSPRCNEIQLENQVLPYSWTWLLLYLADDVGICEIQYTADKTLRSTSFSICPVACPLSRQVYRLNVCIISRRNFELNDTAKIHFSFECCSFFLLNFQHRNLKY